MSDRPMILIDDPQAATPHTMTGWKSSAGYFFSDEKAARYQGCTHVHCKACGAPTEKCFTMCHMCRGAAEQARYDARPKKRWEDEMLYSEALDMYFIEPADAWEEVEEGNVDSIEEMQLVLCQPVRVPVLDDEYLESCLPDDCVAPDAFRRAAEVFNEAVKDIIVSWEPGKYALDLSQETQDVRD